MHVSGQRASRSRGPMGQGAPGFRGLVGKMATGCKIDVRYSVRKPGEGGS